MGRERIQSINDRDKEHDNSHHKVAETEQCGGITKHN